LPDSVTIDEDYMQVLLLAAATGLLLPLLYVGPVQPTNR